MFSSKRLYPKWVYIFPAIFFTYGAFSIFIQCGANLPTPAEQARVGEYAAELTACVELAKTLPESQACRAQVSAKYGRDGGSHD